MHEPKVHNVWGTEFGAHNNGAQNQWSTASLGAQAFGAQPLEHRTIGAQNQWSTESLGAQVFGAQPLEHRVIWSTRQMGHRVSQTFLGPWIYTFSMIEITTYWKAK